jgi:recombinational DNA repair protein (RecF pathway)
MQCCASCGETQDLRLYEVLGGDHVERRWWCFECLISARRLGVSAELAPAWIERAALHQLPMKSLASAQTVTEQIAGPDLGRLGLQLASQYLRALAAQPEALALQDEDLLPDEPVHSVGANVTG